MTQKQTLDAVLGELRFIKKHMPNGEMKIIQKDLESLKEDVSDLKFTLLNPESGVIVNTNKNTEYITEMKAGKEKFTDQMLELEDLKRWKAGVSKALWIIFGTLAAIVIRMLIMHSDTQG